MSESFHFTRNRTTFKGKIIIKLGDGLGEVYPAEYTLLSTGQIAESNSSLQVLVNRWHTEDKVVESFTPPLYGLRAMVMALVVSMSS